MFLIVRSHQSRAESRSDLDLSQAPKQTKYSILESHNCTTFKPRVFSPKPHLTHTTPYPWGFGLTTWISKVVQLWLSTIGSVLAMLERLKISHAINGLLSLTFLFLEVTHLKQIYVRCPFRSWSMRLLVYIKF